MYEEEKVSLGYNYGYEVATANANQSFKDAQVIIISY